MIPPIIHQLFINPHDGSGDGLPDAVGKHRATWAAQHPSFDCRLWTQADILRLSRARNASSVADAIEIAKFPAMKADIARLWLIYEFGGFWVDLKLSARTSFLNDMRSHHVVLAEHFPNASLPEPNGFLINSFLAAPGGSPFFARCIDIATHNVVNRIAGSIFKNVGSGVLMQVIDETSCPVHVMPHTQTWGILFDVGGAPYNHGGLHWSQREIAGESPYN